MSLARKWLITATKILCFAQLHYPWYNPSKSPSHGELMKKVATFALALSLGLTLSWPMAAHAGSKSSRSQTDQQKEAQKTWKQYSKGQKKQQKQQMKAQKKQLKDWKKTNNKTTTTTTTVT